MNKVGFGTEMGQNNINLIINYELLPNAKNKHHAPRQFRLLGGSGYYRFNHANRLVERWP